MKLPYACGDLFALPLGDGTSAQAQIVACGHHTVDVVVRDARGALPAIRASDRALVLHRWRRCGVAPVREAGAPADAYWIGPARVERIVATRFGIASLELPPLVVHAGRSASAGERRLRIAGRGVRVDAREIAKRSSLRVLELSGVTVEHIDALAALPNLHALRLARMERLDLDAVREVRVRALSLETIADLRNVRALRERTDLEQLEMLDLWPLELEAVMPLAELPNVHRAYVDIGGRRKNVELNRRARWAYPWPLDAIELNLPD